MLNRENQENRKLSQPKKRREIKMLLLFGCLWADLIGLKSIIRLEIL